MASVPASAPTYPRSDSRLPDGSSYHFVKAGQLLSNEHVEPFLDPVLETDPEFLQAVADYGASTARCLKRWKIEEEALAKHFDGDHCFGHNCSDWNRETWERQEKNLRRFEMERDEYHKELAIQTPILERFGLDRIKSHLDNRSIKVVADETRADIQREEKHERTLRQQMVRPQMSSEELRKGIKDYNESYRREQYDHNTIDEDWQFPKIVAAAKLNIAAEKRRQRRLIATYGSQVIGSKLTEVSDSELCRVYRTFLVRCGLNPDEGRMSDEQVEIRFQFLDQDLHTINVYAREMQENEVSKDRYPYYMDLWQKAKTKHDELTAKLEEFISQHGRQIVSDMI